MSKEDSKEMYVLSEACSTNSLTLAALVNVLVKKNIITSQELIDAFNEARVSQSTNTKKMKDDIKNIDQ